MGEPTNPPDARPPADPDATATLPLPRVFVSHSSRDAAAATAIVAALESAGVPCWVAPRDIPAGADYNDSIMTGIHGCRALLLVYSRHSVDSGPVKREVERALHHGAKVVPVRLEQAPPSPALEFMISTSQWVDAFPPPLERHLDVVVGAAKGALHLWHEPAKADPNAPPQHVGPYRIVERLGEGGMGTVYKAEQRAPVKRTVAVKVVKAGMGTAEVLARFESERQALARMNHPNVARVLDAGADELGRPYFVMEYVPGLPITMFADANKLSIRQRLELFTQVCEAIAHAHTKAILHRDIKAGNVLAFMDGGKAVAKVIDFGIAKALTGDKLTDRTFNTDRGQAIGTYDSMSPEQAGGSPDIDTRTDVYSLGVLLYELLTGATPFDGPMLRKAADAEIRRIIREVEPPRPSTRLSGMSAAAGSTAAAARQEQVAALAKELRSELEWIPLMAMRKERERRYASPLELAADVANYLADRPLRAGPESVGYRVRKMVRRNRRSLATAAVFVALLAGSVGVYVHTINAARRELGEEQVKTVAALAEATRQRGEAVTEKANAEAVLSFLTDEVLANAKSASIPDAKIRDEIIKAMVNPAAASVGKRFAGQPIIEASVRHTIASIFEQIGRSDLAISQVRRALELRRSVLGPDHPATLESLNFYAIVLKSLGRVAEAEPLFIDALARYTRVLGPDHPATLWSRSNYAAGLILLGRASEAEPLLKDVLARRVRSLGRDDPETLLSMNDNGWVLSALGRPAEAEPLFADALARRTRVLGADHPDTLASLSNYATLLFSIGKAAEAEPLYRDVLARRGRVLGPDHVDSLISLNNYASVLKSLGRAAEAEPLYKEALDRHARVTGQDHFNTLDLQFDYADLLKTLDRPGEAALLFKDLFERRERLQGEDHPLTIFALEKYARVLQRLNRPGEAEPLLRDAFARALRSPQLGPTNPTTIQYAENHALCLDELGRTAEAAAVRARFDVNASGRQTRPAPRPASRPAKT